MPKVSVITPIYRTEKDLDKCLKSLVAQTLPEIEFLWIDNGASDECRQIIQKYADKRKGIRVITLKENIGYCGAMNKGLSLATGEYIGFCDSDDYIDADYYEKLYKKAHETDSEIVYCGLILEYENNSLKKELLQKDEDTNSLFDHLLHGSIWNGLFNKLFLQKNSITLSQNKTSIYRDNTLSIPAVLKAKKTAIVKDVFYHYVQHKKSTISGLNKRTIVEQTYQTLEEIFQKIGSENLDDSFIKFLFRTLPILNLKNFPKEMKKLQDTEIWKRQYSNVQAFSNPTWRQRLFSVSRHLTKPLIKIRFLGISFKIKKKEKKS